MPFSPLVDSLLDVGGVVHGQVVGLLNLVAAANGLGAKAQVADGHAAALVGIVRKVRLSGGQAGSLWSSSQPASLSPLPSLPHPLLFPACLALSASQDSQSSHTLPRSHFHPRFSLPSLLFTPVCTGACCLR